MTEAFIPIEIDGSQYRLRFPGLVQIAIKRKAAEFLGVPGGQLAIGDVMVKAGEGDVEAQAYLLWQGIMGGMPDQRKMKFDEAVELRDKFLQSGELDDGSRYQLFVETLADAIDAAVGADRKKAKARMAGKKEDPGTGGKPMNMESES